MLRVVSYTLIILCALSIGGSVGFFVTYCYFTAPERVSKAVQAMIEEYKTQYCPGDPWHLSKEQRVASMALMSRLTIHAGFGPIAYAEYLKCHGPL